MRPWARSWWRDWGWLPEAVQLTRLTLARMQEEPEDAEDTEQGVRWVPLRDWEANNDRMGRLAPSWVDPEEGEPLGVHREELAGCTAPDREQSTLFDWPDWSKVGTADSQGRGSRFGKDDGTPGWDGPGILVDRASRCTWKEAAAVEAAAVAAAVAVEARGRDALPAHHSAAAGRQTDC